MSYTVFENKESCCGCGACMNICPKRAITMAADSEGFSYPVIDPEKCVECGLCRKICAFQRGTQMPDMLDAPTVYAAKAKDDTIRAQSGSGGLFTVLSDEVLSGGGVIYGVAFDERFKAVHIRADSVDARNLCRGSKYSQSDMGGVFKQIKQDLSQGRQVLFTGTSCQVAAVNEYFAKEDRTNLLLVDIICHGTPSPMLFRQYLDWVEQKRGKKIAAYYHRPKDLGWGHNEKIVYENQTAEIGTGLSETWKNIFYSNNCLRPSCHNCKYTSTDRKSDITIADFWGIEKFSPEFTDTKGVSLVLVNTEKGRRFFDAVADTLNLKEQTIEQAMERNPNLRHPSPAPDSRAAFWKDHRNGGIQLVVRKYGGYNVKHMVKRAIKTVLEKSGLWTVLKRLKTS